MGGSSVLDADDWEVACSPNNVKTLVLFGRTGNGKSATGNSILGKKVFESDTISYGVTLSCKMETTIINGQIVNVIDSPGLFESSTETESEVIGKEIVKCIDLAKGGIHAILVVFSVRTRFSEEEERAVSNLQRLFGSKIADYMVVVFTGGDDLEDGGKTLDDYLGHKKCPNSLKEILSLCDNRCVLFDNKTKDTKKQYKQVQQLLSLVNIVVSNNDGRPYTNELFTKQREQDLLNRITDMVDSKLKETTTKLEQQLAEEKSARQEAEMRSKDEIEKLRKNLEQAHEELRKREANEELGKREVKNPCTIL